MSGERVPAFVESDIAACVALMRDNRLGFTRSELAGFERWLKVNTSP
jgi:hypothetical protein